MYDNIRGLFYLSNNKSKRYLIKICWDYFSIIFWIYALTVILNLCFPAPISYFGVQYSSVISPNSYFGVPKDGFSSYFQYPYLCFLIPYPWFLIPYPWFLIPYPCFLIPY